MAKSLENITQEKRVKKQEKTNSVKKKEKTNAPRPSRTKAGLGLVLQNWTRIIGQILRCLQCCHKMSWMCV